jgi:hypothetical protein
MHQQTMNHGSRRSVQTISRLPSPVGDGGKNRVFQLFVLLVVGAQRSYTRKELAPKFIQDFTLSIPDNKSSQLSDRSTIAGLLFATSNQDC